MTLPESHKVRGPMFYHLLLPQLDNSLLWTWQTWVNQTRRQNLPHSSSRPLIVGHSHVVRLLIYYSLLFLSSNFPYKLYNEDLVRIWGKRNWKKNQAMPLYWEPIIVFKLLLFRCEGTYKLAHTNYVQIFLAFIHIPIIWIKMLF